MKLAVFVVLSALVFIGQVQMFSIFGQKLLSKFLSKIIFFDTQFTTFIIVGLIFGYMSFLSAYSIFSIKIPGFYGFYRKKTDPVTYLSFVYYFSKLIYPLCYTTLIILVSGSREFEQTSFNAV